MAKAETEVKLQRLRKLLSDAQDLTRKSQERMNGLRFSLRERTREAVNLRESLAAQELLMSEDLKKARDRIQRSEEIAQSQAMTIEVQSNEIKLLRSDIKKIDTECDRKAEQINDLRQQLNRIPGWVRRLYRA